MIYTEEIKKQINSAGFQVIEFKRFVKHLHTKITEIATILSKMIRKIGELFRKAVDCIVDFLKARDEIRKMPTKQRYKFCRKLGIENYSVFFQRNQIHRARSCC